MRTIYKYTLPESDKLSLPVPGLVRWLHVGVQYNNPCIWAEVDNEAEAHGQTIYVRGTGHPMRGDEGEHLGTFMLAEGALVFHVFASASEGKA